MDVASELAKLTFPQTSKLNNLQIRSDFDLKKRMFSASRNAEPLDRIETPVESEALASIRKTLLARHLHLQVDEVAPLYENPRNPAGIETLIRRLDEFSDRLSSRIAELSDDAVIFRAAMGTLKASWAARVACALSHAFPGSSGTSASGELPIEVILDSVGDDSGTDPVAELEEQINSEQFQKEYAVLFPEEDVAAKLEYMRRTCAEFRDLPNDPEFQKTVEAYFAVEKKKADTQLRLLKRSLESGTLSQIKYGAKILEQRLLDAEWRNARALLYCLDALKEVKARAKILSKDRKKKSKDNFCSLTKLTDRADELIRKLPSVLKGLEEAKRFAEGLREDREIIVAKRIDAMKTLGAFRARVKEIEEKLNSAEEIAWRELWSDGPLEFVEIKTSPLNESPC